MKNRLMDISLFSAQNPIPYPFRSKIKYYLVHNAVTRSILLLDFDQITSLISARGETS